MLPLLSHPPSILGSEVDQSYAILAVQILQERRRVAHAPAEQPCQLSSPTHLQHHGKIASPHDIRAQGLPLANPAQQSQQQLHRAFLTQNDPWEDSQHEYEPFRGLTAFRALASALVMAMTVVPVSMAALVADTGIFLPLTWMLSNPTAQKSCLTTGTLCSKAVRQLPARKASAAQSEAARNGRVRTLCPMQC